MAKRGPLSAAHKAAISAGLKRYWAGRSGGSSARSSPVSFISSGAVNRAKPRKAATSAKLPAAAKIGAPRAVQHAETGNVISREAAAAIMFGSRGKKATGKKARRTA